MLVSEIVERTGSYVTVFYAVTAALVVGLTATSLLYHRTKTGPATAFSSPSGRSPRTSRPYGRKARRFARESVVDFAPLSDGRVRVTPSKGAGEADSLVVTAGAWARELVPELPELAVPER